MTARHDHLTWRSDQAIHWWQHDLVEWAASEGMTRLALHETGL